MSKYGYQMVYLRNTHDENGYRFKDFDKENRDFVEENTEGLIHFTRKDQWMNIYQIVEQAAQYNSQFGGSAFNTDTVAAAEEMAYLAHLGFVQVAYIKPNGAIVHIGRN